MPRSQHTTEHRQRACAHLVRSIVDRILLAECRDAPSFHFAQASTRPEASLDALTKLAVALSGATSEPAGPSAAIPPRYRCAECGQGFPGGAVPRAARLAAVLRDSRLAIAQACERSGEQARRSKSTPRRSLCGKFSSACVAVSCGFAEAARSLILQRDVRHDNGGRQSLRSTKSLPRRSLPAPPPPQVDAAHAYAAASRAWRAPAAVHAAPPAVFIRPHSGESWHAVLSLSSSVPPPLLRRPGSPEAPFLLASLLARCEGFAAAEPLFHLAASLSPPHSSTDRTNEDDCAECEQAAATAALSRCQLALSLLLQRRAEAADRELISLGLRLRLSSGLLASLRGRRETSPSGGGGAGRVVGAGSAPPSVAIADGLVPPSLLQRRVEEEKKWRCPYVRPASLLRLAATLLSSLTADTPARTIPQPPRRIPPVLPLLASPRRRRPLRPLPELQVRDAGNAPESPQFCTNSSGVQPLGLPQIHPTDSLICAGAARGKKSARDDR